MEREEIICMAREAGILQSTDTEVARMMIAGLKYFAKLVAAKEREACAQECERAYSVSAVSYETGAACARFIRARSKA